MQYMKPANGEDTMCFKNSTGVFALYPVDTVLYSTAFTINATPSGSWIPFTLTTPFYYNAISNFIVEIKPGVHTEPQNYLYAQTFVAPSASCRRSGAWSSPTALQNYQQVLFIGFDIIPTGVSNLSTATNVRLYPNPSEGIVTFELKTPERLSNLTISVVSTTGSIISHHHYQDITGTFSKQLDVTSLPKGLYFVEVKGDNEKQVKKLLIQ